MRKTPKAILMILCLSVYAQAQNLIRDGIFSEPDYNWTGNPDYNHCSMPIAAHGNWLYWVGNQGIFHECHILNPDPTRPYYPRYAPGNGLMPVPRRGEGYSAIVLARENISIFDSLSFNIFTDLRYLVQNFPENTFESGENYVLEFFLQNHPTAHYGINDLCIYFNEEEWRQGYGDYYSNNILYEKIRFDSLIPNGKWVHIRQVLQLTGQERSLFINSGCAEQSSVVPITPLVVDSGHNFSIDNAHHSAILLIDDIWLYKASDTLFSVDLGADTLLCPGEWLRLEANPEGFKLEDTLTLWEWSTGDTSSWIIVETPGTYWVEVTINERYTYRDTIVVEYEQPLRWNHPFGDTLVLCVEQGEDGKDVLAPFLSHEGTYLWSTGSNEPSIYVYEEGQYYLEINTYCFDEVDSFFMEVQVCERPPVYIPNAFSPTGHNREWIIPGLEKGTRISVFDRWGKRVFHHEDYKDNWWDGRFQGQLLPSGVYTYIIYAPRGDGFYPIERSGTVSIIR